jgi:hypothetical protein
MLRLDVIGYPCDDMIFEHPFNQLMQEIWREKSMDICSGKGVRERLKNMTTSKH